MNRKKYKVSSTEYRNFEKQYLLDTLRDPDKYIPFGMAFLKRFDQVTQEYINLGGDLGMAEAEKLWNEPDREKAKRIIAMWIE